MSRLGKTRVVVQDVCEVDCAAEACDHIKTSLGFPTTDTPS